MKKIFKGSPTRKHIQYQPTTTMKNESIILIGMAGVGKSTTGKLLAEKLEFYFTDVDDVMAKKYGKTVMQEIIDEKGEETFMKIEKETMSKVDLNHRVVVPGGSIIYHLDLMDKLKKQATLVYLKDTFENIERREKERGIRGVVGLKEGKTFKDVFNERSVLYSKYADITIDVCSKTTDEIVEKIIQSL